MTPVHSRLWEIYSHSYRLTSEVNAALRHPRATKLYLLLLAGGNSDRLFIGNAVQYIKVLHLFRKPDCQLYENVFLGFVKQYFMDRNVSTFIMQR